MDDQQHKRRVRCARAWFWLMGLGSLVWLLLRSGAKPRRIAYPCQQAALASSVGFVGYLLSLTGAVYLYHHLRREVTVARASFFLLACIVMSALQASTIAPPRPARAAFVLPSWTSPGAISDVFVATNVPVPECSLDGGVLPTTPPCKQQDYALHDEGVDRLINLMVSKGTHFYRTSQHPAGLVGKNDIVVVKINNQWGGYGDGSGAGRLATNTDVLKGLIWRILQHPADFQGEVVVAENAQWEMEWDIETSNAQDQGQSFLDVITTFHNLGYPVSRKDWGAFMDQTIHGGAVNGGGYPSGEYAQGNNSDAYILLEDSAGSGIDELSYPKFRTEGGAYVSMRYGVWDGSGYHADRLTFINLPVLKRHGMAGSTIAWKNLIGFVTIHNDVERYGGWDEMHRFYWGYEAQSGDAGYGLIGRQLALICAPDLHIIDAIWVGYEDNTSGPASRQNVLLASTDPFAVDWYTSEYVLRPLATWDPASTSAARGGTFRDATRTNQNVARSVWPGGSGQYPYIDLLDGYDGGMVSDEEKNQINVYLSTESPAPTLTSSLYLPMLAAQ